MRCERRPPVSLPLSPGRARGTHSKVTFPAAPDPRICFAVTPATRSSDLEPKTHTLGPDRKLDPEPACHRPLRPRTRTVRGETDAARRSLPLPRTQGRVLGALGTAGRVCGASGRDGAVGPSLACLWEVPRGTCVSRKYVFWASGEVRNGCPCPLGTSTDEPVRVSNHPRLSTFLTGL